LGNYIFELPFLLSLRTHFTSCHCERGVAIPEKQNSKIKGQNDRAKMKKQSA